MKEKTVFKPLTDVKERAVLVGVILKDQPVEQEMEYLDELAFLAETAGAQTLKSFTQKLDHTEPRTFVGSGKLAEINEYIKANEINLAVFDDELSPSQQRNIEKILQIKVLDRTQLILDIFARRARTAQAQVQVELAQYQYLMPRLTRMWTHLEKQQGGIGNRGPGEKEIETDRRIVRDRLSKLRERLKEIEKQGFNQRKARGNMVRVALVGYTNVGKSTIMNLLSKSDVFAENKLFATLDTTVRKVVFDNIPFLLSDTVGFIRKLPHHLVESFKSTLDEVREADILIHVIDVSHPNFEAHIDVVNHMLQELGSADKPVIQVFNKIDAFTYVKKEEDDLTPANRENISLGDLRKTWMNKSKEATIFISATEKENIAELRKILLNKVKAIHLQRYPNNKD
ncbi:MAG TPA: GTPase HflX [Bacteroidia bacterium]|nr:GTPase HflX [Bacteroidia bacterium]HMU20521.1 GTPase HflX [Bacteroidia bacterium]